jgi:hypothetical protein
MRIPAGDPQAAGRQCCGHGPTVTPRSSSSPSPTSTSRAARRCRGRPFGRSGSPTVPPWSLLPHRAHQYIGQVDLADQVQLRPRSGPLTGTRAQDGAIAARVGASADRLLVPAPGRGAADLADVSERERPTLPPPERCRGPLAGRSQYGLPGRPCPAAGCRSGRLAVLTHWWSPGPWPVQRGGAMRCPAEGGKLPNICISASRWRSFSRATALRMSRSVHPSRPRCGKPRPPRSAVPARTHLTR